jgi:hypothetical protein
MPCLPLERAVPQGAKVFCGRTHHGVQAAVLFQRSRHRLRGIAHSPVKTKQPVTNMVALLEPFIDDVEFAP